MRAGERARGGWTVGIATDVDTRRAFLATGLVVAYGAVAPRVLPPTSVVPNLTVAATGVAAARWWGRSWAELGLDPVDARRGLRFGAAAVPVVAGAVATVAAVPALRRLLRDERVLGLSDREAAFHALVRIPLATALAEEVLFRSVLLGQTGTGGRRVRAVVWTSMAFGLWHVLPALHSHRSNRQGGAATTVTGTVVATAGVGAALAVLRLRSRSVVAPVIAHAAVNGLTFVAARLVGRRARR